MKTLIACLFALSAPVGQIKGWQNTSGITEQEAIQMATQGATKFLELEDERETCTAEEFWGYSYKPAKVTSGKPAFAVELYASAPDSSCSDYANFDCRSVFVQEPNGQWRESFTECDKTTLSEE